MKIFELAKQTGAKTGDLVKIAKDMGIEKAYNFTNLSDAQVRAILSKAGDKPASKKVAPASLPEVPAEEEKPVYKAGVPLKAVSKDEDRALLSGARARALSSYKARMQNRKPYVSIKVEKADEAKISVAAQGRAMEVKPHGSVPVAAPAPETSVDAKPVVAAPSVKAEGKEPKPADKNIAPVLESEQSEVVSQKAESLVDLSSLGSGWGGGSTSMSSNITFHPAENDYRDDDDDDYDRQSRSRDDDDDLEREYFGKHSGPASQQMKHHRDDREESGGRDGHSRQGHGQQAQRGQQGMPQRNQGSQQQRGGQQGSRQGHGNSQNNARPGSQQRGQQRGAQQGGRQGQQGSQQRSGQQPQGRPGQNQPQRSQQAQSVFPTRPGAQSVFPTRPGAQSVFPTRPGAQPVRLPQQPMQNGGQRNGQMQQMSKNQRGQQPMNKNQRQQGQQKGKLPVAPPMPVPPPPAPNSPIAGDHVITIRGTTLIRELAEMMGIRPNRLIADLMQDKVLVSINQRVDIEMAGKIADKYGYRVELERARRSTERKPEIRRLDEDDEIPEDKPEDMKPRPPVVTFMGHVDHGKTSLLDYLRKTKVTASEAGGITQHIGAYTVDVSDRKITFLDTPGHAAFSAMRARGARLTDIAIIVVAADDGIMPQTREVIKDCRQANVQIMVAINKCDLPSAKPDRVRQQLQGEGLTPEDWGGDIVCCEVSAHTGEGMDNLLEMILLQADVLELQANPNRRADGYIIEAQMERGIGPTATLLVASGTLSVGDVVLIDEHYGRLRALTDDRGNQVKSVGPAMAVRVMGLSGVPEAGAEFRVMKNEKRAKELAEKFAQDRKAEELQQAQKAVNVDTLLDRLGEQRKKQLSIIVKADTQGTVEAIIDTLRDIRSEKISLEILGSSVGNVSATDVQRAAAGHAMIVGFQVTTEAGVIPIATHDGVRISTFRIIYELFDFVKQSLLDLLDPEYKEVPKGKAQIRQIFDIGKLGKVAGSQLLEGVVRKDARVRILRRRDVLFDGTIASLKHFKDEVNEVRDMQEFGVNFEGFEDFREGDVIECYAMEELERTL